MRTRSQEPADSRYLYEQIYLELRKEILAGKYRRGDWFPPERVLKDRFGTTHLTVRNALAKLVLEGYIERYSGKGTVVIYSRERAAAPRRELRFPWAHVILESLDEGNATLLEKLEAQLRKVPLAVRISCHGGDVPLEQGLLREAERSGALVVLQPAQVANGLVPAEGRAEGRTEGRAEAAARSTIIIGGFDSGGPGPRVFVDCAEGTRRVVRILLERGHRQVALLAAASMPGVQEAFLGEVAARGLPPAAGVFRACPTGVDAGESAARALLASQPDCRAFFCLSDETAVGALAALRAAGPGPGPAVIGFGNTRLARGLRVSSVDPRQDLVAERVFGLVAAAMREGALPDHVTPILPELSLRGT